MINFRIKLDYLLKKNPAVEAAIKKKGVYCDTR